MTGGPGDRQGPVTRPGRPRPLGRRALARCAEAQEAVSARLDGEPSSMAGSALDLHLARCQECRDFEMAAVAFGRRARLRAPRPVPEDLVAKLVPLLEPARPGLVAAVRQWRGRAGPGSGWAGSGWAATGWASTARWAGALAPAVAAVIAISIGVGSHPHLVPTRPPSPCTVGLVVHHVPRPR